MTTWISGLSWSHSKDYLPSQTLIMVQPQVVPRAELSSMVTSSLEPPQQYLLKLAWVHPSHRLLRMHPEPHAALLLSLCCIAPPPLCLPSLHFFSLEASTSGWEEWQDAEGMRNKLEDMGCHKLRGHGLPLSPGTTLDNTQ